MLYSGYILWQNSSAFTKAALLMDVPDHQAANKEVKQVLDLPNMARGKNSTLTSKQGASD